MKRPRAVRTPNANANPDADAWPLSRLHAPISPRRCAYKAVLRRPSKYRDADMGGHVTGPGRSKIEPGCSCRIAVSIVPFIARDIAIWL